MSQRMDVRTPMKRSDGGTWWPKIGSAWQARSGEGWDIKLDMMPAPVDGQWKLVIRPPKEGEDKPAKSRDDRPADDEPVDEIPF